MKTLKFNQKQIRSKVIKEYIKQADYKKVVCFSCGNASQALKDIGIDTLDISPSGDLVANRWWQPYEIEKTFKGYFDATSGHLPLHLMVEVAKAFKSELGELSDTAYLVPTGSGETIVCLGIAYPDIKFTAVYDNNVPAIEYNAGAPLNQVVSAMFKVIKLN